LRVAVVFLLCALSAGALSVNAEEIAAAPPGLSLVMIEEHGCGFCMRWLEEVGPGYGQSEEGRRAPLVRIDRESRDAERFQRIVYTPTFVLMRDGAELGRITGYPGADFFWSMLADMLRKVEAAGEAPGHSKPGASGGTLNTARP